MSSPTADVSVRVAWADDARGIAGVQVRVWREAYADLLPPAALDVDQVAEVWSAALTTGRDARNRVLVALERNRIAGFAVTMPAADPDCDPISDGEVAELGVAPEDRRLGHGSRLVQACADTLVADRFTRAVTWLNAGDDALRAFLTDAGWAPDGAHRELDLHGDGSVTVKQVRLHTALGPAG
ncbi:GNAT family N-acetyltransferase [Nocardioides donggukensis]|uniref:GNAT family N-acetyltransferase n=1 Tax=Nocardioides donggukensis TaxID=2774019 RepID=A0A927K3Q6_9ACTN|nr:GNAT family N-acetyltransferase [Nocardioides donggukensis]MBD8869103.1 GNAT family N-acetyltransferase [Nocardioides donggukensis]